MSKLLYSALITTLLFTSSPTLAGTCASKCGPRPIQFTPGQRIRIAVINRTYGIVNIEKLLGTKPLTLRPGQQLFLEQGDGTEPNVSLVFWDENSSPLKAVVSKPDFGTLRVEIRPGNRVPGDRSVYILNDGRVNVF
jgi:hypothetical protein